MDFDSLPSDAPAAPQQTQAPTTQLPGQPQDFDSLQDDNDKYSTTSQQIGAGLEGVGRGVAGPLFTGAEKIFDVPEEDIRGRQKANPWTAGIGEAAGLGAGMVTGTGEAALMTKAGELGLESLGMLGKAGEAASLTQKIGSSAVQQAIEMGVLSGSDETSKLLLHDPNTSAESAIINTGIGSVLGAGFGAATGVISPLWKATAGPKVQEMLDMLGNKLSGKSLIEAPEGIVNDLQTLGIHDNVTPLQRADLAENPTADNIAKNLIRSENPEFMNERQAMKENVANSVVEPLGSNIEDMRVYDNNEAGKVVGDKIKDQIKTTFEPLWQQMDKRNAEAALLGTSDDSRLGLMDKLRERGVNEYSPNSPYTKIFYDAGDRALDFENLAHFDKYDGELRDSMNAAFRSGKSEEGVAYSKVRGMLKDYKNSVIEDAASQAGNKQAGADYIAARNELNKKYAMAEGVREDLGEHFNIDSRNSRDFMKKLDENMTPEQVLKKFSIKNNMNGAEFLRQNFPDAFQEVVKNERRALLKPAINSAKDDMPIDVAKLNKIIESAKSGKDSYLKTILPKEFLDRAEAGSRVLSQMTNPKDSGTPAGLAGMLRGVGSSALGAVGFFSGHGLGASLVAGEMATRLGKEGREAAQLGILRFLGSKEPISAPGFKAMVNFFDQTYKGQNMLSRAVVNTLKPGAMVLAANSLPSQADRDKLEKNLTKMQSNPDQYTNTQSEGQLGHYLQQHQVAMTQASTRIASYLESLKPKTNLPNTLDKAIPPSKIEEARYKRAQDIAINPMIVLSRIKSGSLQPTDIQDLNNMYPGVYGQIVHKLTSEIGDMQSKDGTIPYKTRMSLSLFMGQPLDSTMQPMSIQSAQASMMPAQPPTPQGKKPTAEAGKAMSKGVNMYKTTSQSAEGDRSARKSRD